VEYFSGWKLFCIYSVKITISLKNILGSFQSIFELDSSKDSQLKVISESVNFRFHSLVEDFS
jgi:hypothetical protein